MVLLLFMLLLSMVFSAHCRTQTLTSTAWWRVSPRSPRLIWDATAFLSGEDTGHWQNNPLLYECYLFKAPCFLFPFQAARQSEFLEMKVRAQSAKICGPPPINLEILLEMFNLRGQDLYCGSDHHLQKRT